MDQKSSAGYNIIGVHFCWQMDYCFQHKPTGFIPTEDDGRLIMTFEIPESGSTTRSLTVIDSMMKIAQTVPGVLHVAALGGLNFLTGGIKVQQWQYVYAVETMG